VWIESDMMVLRVTLFILYTMRYLDPDAPLVSVRQATVYIGTSSRTVACSSRVHVLVNSSNMVANSYRFNWCRHYIEIQELSLCAWWPHPRSVIWFGYEETKETRWREGKWHEEYVSNRDDNWRVEGALCKLGCRIVYIDVPMSIMIEFGMDK